MSDTLRPIVNSSMSFRLCVRLLLCLLLVLGALSQSARAIPRRIDVLVAANGYDASGTYHTVLLGEGQEWTFKLFGVPDGEADKAAVNFIDFTLFDENGNALTLKDGTAVTGYNTSDGRTLTNTEQWERQPSATEYW